MKPFSTLFTKILFWFFLNLALVAVVLGIFFTIQSQVDFEGFWSRQATDRMRIAGRLISHELGETSVDGWSTVLSRYSEIYQIDFALILNPEHIISSKEISVPSKVMTAIEDMGIFRDSPGKYFRRSRHHTEDTKFREPYSPRRSGPRLMIRTQDPTKYWAGIIVPVYTSPGIPPKPAMLLAVSDSITGNGFFFDPIPWIFASVLVVALSVVFWIPFVRRITKPLERMTRATEKIARGRFDVKIDEPGSDEIGRLARAINHMTSQLSGYVNGQKLFLRDVAHELGSPIARIQLGLGILEQMADENNRDRIKDVLEDAVHMSNLVSELLSFSRAEIMPQKVKLLPTDLLEIVEKAVDRESRPGIEMIIDIPHGLTVFVAPELLTRALSNLLRNAVRYAGHFGPVKITAKREKDEVIVRVIDSGPGVPDHLLNRLFEPFYRPEPSRKRESGGVGLGLAIVKTCVSTCKGSVTAENLKPTGFVVTIRIPGTDKVLRTVWE
jgi:two-component system, OmpR family, sensor histidine kinase CpxA